MALDLSVSQAAPERPADRNNNVCVVDLSLPRKEDHVFPPGSTLLEAGESGRRKQLHQLLGLGDSKGLDKLLPNLDITAINLLCLARLQETAAALSSLAPALGGSRRPPPAHLPLFLGGHTVSSSCQGVRRNHRCEQPGCDKVRKKICNAIVIFSLPMQ